MQDPFICDVLEGRHFGRRRYSAGRGRGRHDRITSAFGAPTRGLAGLEGLHCLYQRSPAVDRALARMAAILANKTSAAAAGANRPTCGNRSKPRDRDDIPGAEAIPGPQKPTYKICEKCEDPQTSAMAWMQNSSQHLFPSGTGGWQNDNGSFSQYARKRLLSLDSRFEASTAYIMWLLEMQTKKRTFRKHQRPDRQPAGALRQ